VGTITVAMPERSISVIWASAATGSLERVIDRSGRPAAAMIGLIAAASVSAGSLTPIASRRFLNMSRTIMLGV
jgi:hypothetical protein